MNIKHLITILILCMSFANAQQESKLNFKEIESKYCRNCYGSLVVEKENLSDKERHQKMNSANPKYVLRNYMAQLSIDDANNGNYDLIDELFQLLKQPYAEQPKNEKWFAKRPEWARHKIGCSMLSCSS